MGKCETGVIWALHWQSAVEWRPLNDKNTFWKSLNSLFFHVSQTGDSSFHQTDFPRNTENIQDDLFVSWRFSRKIFLLPFTAMLIISSLFVCSSDTHYSPPPPSLSVLPSIFHATESASILSISLALPPSDCQNTIFSHSTPQSTGLNPVCAFLSSELHIKMTCLN